MRSITLAQLRAQARSLADMELGAGLGDNSFVSDSELLNMLNASIGVWHGMVAMADPERFEKIQTITATGQASYSLPSDYYSTLGLDYLGSDSRYYSLERVTFSERNRYQDGSASYGYRIAGNTLYLVPTPSTGTYRHTYVKQAPELSADTDEIDGVNGWEQWIVYDTAIRMLIKEQSDVSRLAAERDRIQQEILVAAMDRDFANPRHIADTRNTARVLNDYAWGFRWP